MSKKPTKKHAEGATSSRSWRKDDAVKKMDKQNFLSGSFSPEEKETIKQAVDKWIEEQEDYNGNQGDREKFLERLKWASEHKIRGVWCRIAEISGLDNRRVQSIRALVVRVICPGNYQGRWSPEEENAMVELVEEIGRNWKEIGKRIGRTQENVWNKWKEINKRPLEKDKNGIPMWDSNYKRK